MVNRITVPTEITPELAYLCGVIAGDGCISIRPEKHDHCVYCTGNSADEQEFYIAVVAPLMHKVFGLEVKPKLLSRNQCFGFSVSSKQLAHYLTEVVGLPVGRKYEKLMFPKIFSSDPTLAIAFIRGLFDTDGCISFKKRDKDRPYYPVISFSTQSNKFAFQVAYELTKQDLLAFTHSKITEDERFDCKFTFLTTISMNGVYNFELWQQKFGFWNPKHQAKIAKWEVNDKYLNREYKK